MHSFLKFLSAECAELGKLDRRKSDLEDEVGQESYDGQMYILINETSKYIHHITKRVDLLQKHVGRRCSYDPEMMVVVKHPAAHKTHGVQQYMSGDTKPFCFQLDVANTGAVNESCPNSN